MRRSAGTSTGRASWICLCRIVPACMAITALGGCAGTTLTLPAPESGPGIEWGRVAAEKRVVVYVRRSGALVRAEGTIPEGGAVQVRDVETK